MDAFGKVPQAWGIVSWNILGRGSRGLERVLWGRVFKGVHKPFSAGKGFLPLIGMQGAFLVVHSFVPRHYTS